MVVAFLWMLLVSVAGAAEGSATADVLTYEIGPGDELHLEVVGQEDMSGDIRVDTEGVLPIPLAGQVPIGGMTLDAAQRAITAHLASGYLRNPQVLLGVKGYQSKLVDVSGGVVKPGTYPIQGGIAGVSKIILASGGLIDASAPRAEIWRDVDGVRQVIQVDLDRINKGEQMADVAVRAGDHVYVPQVEQIFVDGQVQKPGAIIWRDGMTLTEAIIQAGSTLGTARLQGVYIMRGTDRIDVNYKRIQEAKEADIALRPSDRIVVPESVF
jgi:polysaccharide export outer membrane protein